MQAVDGVGLRLVGDEHRDAHRPRQTAVDDGVGFLIEFFCNGAFHDSEVAGAVHHPQGETAKLVTKGAHPRRQHFFAVGAEFFRHLHRRVVADGTIQRGGSEGEVTFEQRVGIVLADDQGKFLRAAQAALEGFFGGFVGAVLEGDFDADHFASGDFLACSGGGTVHVAVLDVAADFIEGAFFQVAFNQFVDEGEGAIRGFVEDLQVILQAFEISGLCEIVVDLHVAVESGRHKNVSLFG